MFISPPGERFVSPSSSLCLKHQREPCQLAFTCSPAASTLQKGLAPVKNTQIKVKQGLREERCEEDARWQADRARKTWEVPVIPLRSALLGLCVAPGWTLFVYITSARTNTQTHTCTQKQKSACELPQRHTHPMRFYGGQTSLHRCFLCDVSLRVGK